MRFKSKYGLVALTDERKKHIPAFHPDVIGCFRYFSNTIAEPKRMSRSVHDLSVIICYRYLSRRKKYLAIVIKTGSHPFVLTAYLAKRPKHDIL